MVLSTLLLMTSQRFEFVFFVGSVSSTSSSSSADSSFFGNIVIDLDFSMTNEAERADAARRLPDILYCSDSTPISYQ